MFKLRESKLGFSLIEMMLLLLILSLMTAASVPILSRKHKKAPVKAFHGRYACFWNGNQLWQQQYSGENIIQNEAVAQCKFEAPKKANYFSGPASIDDDPFNFHFFGATNVELESNTKPSNVDMTVSLTSTHGSSVWLDSFTETASMFIDIL